MHEYLTLYNKNRSYGECIECNKRTPHICLKCNYCYSCHPKMERIEKEEQAKKLIKYLYSQNNNNQKGARQQQYPKTFVTYAISRTRITTKWFRYLGRTIPSFRIATVVEEKEWKSFRNSLDKSDRKIFDQMFSVAHMYNSASSYTTKPVRIQPILMSIIFHHYKQLVKLSKEIKESKRSSSSLTSVSEISLPKGWRKVNERNMGEFPLGSSG